MSSSTHTSNCSPFFLPLCLVESRSAEKRLKSSSIGILGTASASGALPIATRTRRCLVTVSGQQPHSLITPAFRTSLSEGRAGCGHSAPRLLGTCQPFVQVQSCASRTYVARRTRCTLMNGEESQRMAGDSLASVRSASMKTQRRLNIPLDFFFGFQGFRAVQRLVTHMI